MKDDRKGLINSPMQNISFILHYIHVLLKGGLHL